MGKSKVYHLETRRKRLLHSLDVSCGAAYEKKVINIQHKNSDVITISPNVDNRV